MKSITNLSSSSSWEPGYTHLSLGERFLGVLQNSLKARMENLHMQDWSRSVGMVLGLSICLE